MEEWKDWLQRVAELRLHDAKAAYALIQETRGQVNDPGLLLCLDASEAASLRNLGELESARRLAEQVLAADPEGNEYAYATAVAVTATLAIEAGRSEDAMQSLERAQALLSLSDQDDDLLAAVLHYGIASAAQLQHQLPQARDALIRAIARCPQSSQLMPVCFSTLGGVLGDMGNYEEAIHAHSQVLARRPVLNPAVVGWALHNLAATYRDAQRLAQAEETSRECLALVAGTDGGGGVNDPRLNAYSYLLRGHIELSRGDPESALQWLTRGHEHTRKVDTPDRLAYAHNLLAWCHVELSEPQEALRHLSQSQRLSQQPLPHAHRNLIRARCQSLMGQEQEALSSLKSALSHFELANAPHGDRVEALRVASDLHERAGDLRTALCFQRECHQLVTDGVERSATARIQGLRWEHEIEHARMREEALRTARNELADRVARQDAHLEDSKLKLASQLAETLRLKEQRDLAEEQLRNAQKLEAVGRVAAGVTHDINNVLTIIAGSVELLRRYSKLESRIEQDAVHAIREACHRAGEITGQLLAFCRHQPRNPRPLDIALLVEHAEPMLRRLLPPHVNLNICNSADSSWVMADATQIEQVLMNLIVNSCDAIKDQGTIEVTLSTPCKDFIRICVEDDGVGIPSEMLDKVLEPFFSTKPEGRGTGLGLSTAYGIILQHEGKLEIDSAPDAGTQIYVTLPTTEHRVDNAQPAPQSCADSELAVLVVEDDSAVRNVMSKWLTSRGHRVTVAVDGQDALNVLRSRDAEFDVVVSDVVMPTVGGLQLLRQARQKWPRLRFLLTSGYPPDHAAIPADVRFLAKPFRSQELTDALQSVSGDPA